MDSGLPCLCLYLKDEEMLKEATLALIRSYEEEDI